jgi:hypothetical protein
MMNNETEQKVNKYNLSELRRGFFFPPVKLPKKNEI